MFPDELSSHVIRLGGIYLNHALFHQLTKFGHQVGKVTYILKSNVKVLAELYEKSMSEAYFPSLCASLAHISPTRCLWLKDMHWPWIMFISRVKFISDHAKYFNWISLEHIYAPLIKILWPVICRRLHF